MNRFNQSASVLGVICLVTGALFVLGGPSLLTDSADGLRPMTSEQQLAMGSGFWDFEACYSASCDDFIDATDCDRYSIFVGAPPGNFPTCQDKECWKTCDLAPTIVTHKCGLGTQECDLGGNQSCGDKVKGACPYNSNPQAPQPNGWAVCVPVNEGPCPGGIATTESCGTGVPSSCTTS